MRASICTRCGRTCAAAFQDDPRDGDGIHVHRVHLNVQDRARTLAFYQDYFGAQTVRLNGDTEVLLAEPILLMLEERSEPPSATLPTGLQHIGFGAADPVAWYDEAHARGIEPDTRGHTVFNTNETPTEAGPGTALEAMLGAVPALFSDSGTDRYSSVTRRT